MNPRLKRVLAPSTGSRPAVRPRPVRFLAYVVYTIGTILCLSLIVGILDRLARDAPLAFAVNLFVVVIPWWITAGLGVRLGLEPHEYFHQIGRFLGLTRDHPYTS